MRLWLSDSCSVGCSRPYLRCYVFRTRIVQPHNGYMHDNFSDTPAEMLAAASDGVMEQ